MSTIIDMQGLDKLIVGRVKPSIYAFTTNTIPNYLKVGDTYRPVIARLNEWRKYFPDLSQSFQDTAALSDDVFFRDHAVHRYLEYVLHYHRLQQEDITDDIYYSREFFKDATADDVAAAIQDIRDSYESGSEKGYQFYDATTKLPEQYSYASTGFWKPRPNQEKTISNFKHAVDNGRNNLLMYAVMRFGKSFTALCCAKEIEAKTVLVLSAKADVKEEWKKTVQSADNFNKEYDFLSSDDLEQNPKAISDTLNAGRKVVLFLTLQDLQGNKIKVKHADLFTHTVNLLIVDETHYGARAERYGKVIRDASYTADTTEEGPDEDFFDIAEAQSVIDSLSSEKALSVDVTLHLSGTPYRILMGTEFEKEDIIAFYQFTDIAREQAKWDEEHLHCDDAKEWDNPYFGFPQMVRFAFTPSKAAMALLDTLKSNGVSYAFSALLKPQSIKKDANNLHKKFAHEDEVLDLFMAIDGSKSDDAVLSFLDYDKIKEGKMCQHMVIVLPYCASCDALEALIKGNADKFKNLGEYEIINISGVDSSSEYSQIGAIKSKIRDCENAGKKTITLTVNRMLTGSTVEQWDTMIYLRDTASPQQYDQAIFRLQNQYIKEYPGADGDIVRFNMKPQTLLVDFDPHRMFSMQEQKAMAYNVNTVAGGNQLLRARIEEELRISPIIQINKNKICQVEPNDILEYISEYSSSRGVMDETYEIPVDFSLFEIEEIKRVIEQQAEIGSKDGLSYDGYTGDSEDYENPEGDDPEGDDAEGKKKSSAGENPGGDEGENSSKKDEIKSLEKKFRTYYTRILFYAFLTGDTVESLDDILSHYEGQDNLRIAKNLGLSKNILRLFKSHMNFFVLRKLDYKIQNINRLAHDDSVDPIKRALTAIRKFDRISESEVTTPDNVTGEMVSLIPDECFLNMGNHRIMDIGSKMGEFAIAIVKRCIALGLSIDDIRDNIMSIPTSTIAYEFTRKVYEVLGLDVSMIVSNFNSYDLQSVKVLNKKGKPTDDVDYARIKQILSQPCLAAEISLDDRIDDGGDSVVFDAIVGNPPYALDTDGAGRQAKPIYNLFMEQAKALNPHYISMIIPSRWFSGGMGLDAFRIAMMNDSHISKIVDYTNAKDCFPGVSISGGVCYFLWNRDVTADCDFINITNSKSDALLRPLNEFDTLVRYNKAVSIIHKIRAKEEQGLDTIISSLMPFGLSTKYRGKVDRTSDEDLALHASNGITYIKRNEISKGEDVVDRYKILVSKTSAEHAGEPGKDGRFKVIPSSMKVLSPGEVCTHSYFLIGNWESKDIADNALLYVKTRFVRFLMLLCISGFGLSKLVFQFVPIQDFTLQWTDEKLYAKYGLTDDEISFIESMVKPMD